ncbi:MAG: CpsD/CapB family tyrosine-protein kinase [Polyangiaceae bacterium]
MNGPTSFTATQGVDRQLDLLIDRLAPLAENPAARALLIEARRLKSVIDNWRTVPPQPFVREEMIGRVMHLSAAVGDMLPPSGRPPPPPSQMGWGGRAPQSVITGAAPEETVITEGDSALPQTPLDVHPVKIHDELSVHLSMLRDPYSVGADAYRALRHQLSKRGDPKVVGVTSALPKEGKTTAAINLAASLREGARGRVLLVEANLRSPAVAATLGFMPPACFQEQLARHRREPLDPWVAAEVLPSLHMMAVNPVNKFPPLVDPIAFSIAIDRLRLAGYDYIVVDTPASLESADVSLIADSVDGFVLTTMARRSDAKAVKRSIELLGSRTFLGAILLE